MGERGVEGCFVIRLYFHLSLLLALTNRNLLIINNNKYWYLVSKAHWSPVQRQFASISVKRGRLRRLKNNQSEIDLWNLEVERVSPPPPIIKKTHVLPR